MAPPALGADRGTGPRTAAAPPDRPALRGLRRHHRSTPGRVEQAGFARAVLVVPAGGDGSR
ncbi:MAG TPA: hypothetical protein VFC16_02715 [Nakamurella sp.]|nr:hypothetical protein [Nakamurella sp.]